MRLSGRFPALAERNFRLFFTGQSIALVGGFAHNVALSWLAYRLSESALVLGIVGSATLLPMLVVSPLAGLLGDRYPRRRLLFVVLTAVAVQCLVLAALTAAGWMTVSGVIAIALVRGVLFSFEVPLRHAFLGDLVLDRAVLPNAVALHSTAFNTARFIGPAIGGGLIGISGEAACFAFHALTLTATLFQLRRIETPEPRHARTYASFTQDYIEGWRYAFGHRPIRALLLSVFVVGFSVSPYAFLMPAAVAETHAARPELLGLFLSSAGFGAMAAALPLAFRRGIGGQSWIVLIRGLSAGMGITSFAWHHGCPSRCSGAPQPARSGPSACCAPGHEADVSAGRGRSSARRQEPEAGIRLREGRE